MIHRSVACVGFVGILLTFSASAFAHFNLVAPPQVSNDTGGGKGAPPCGPDTGTSAMPTEVAGGHPLTMDTLHIDETTRHGGFYRFALAIHSRDELPPDNVVYDGNNMILPPTGTPSGTSDHADFEDPPVFPVLADNVFPHDQGGPSPSWPADCTGDHCQVMIPNINCDRCTLQVIEFMHPHGFNTGGGYFYHHCAEIKITADPNLPLFGEDGGTPETGGAGGASAGTGGTSSEGGEGGAFAGGAAGQNTGGAGGTATNEGGTAGHTVGSAGVAGSNTGGSVGAAGAEAGAGGETTKSGSHSSGGCALVPNSESNPLTLLLALTLPALALGWRRRR